MICFRGWLGFAAAASFLAAPPTARGGFDVQEVSPEAGARARALALHFGASSAERGLERGEALAAFEALLAIDPGQVDAARRAAKLAVGIGQRDRGLALVEAAREANPGVIAAHLNAARFFDDYRPEGEEEACGEQALLAARVAEDLFPEDARVCSLLVGLFLQIGKLGDAAAAVERFEARGGDDVGYWLELAVAGERCLERDEEGKAINRGRVDGLYGRALKISAGDPAVADVVANYHIGARQYDRAMEVLEPVIAAHPELGLGREKLARIYRIRGRAEKALAEARALTTAFPNEARTQRLMAELLTEAAKFQEAVAYRRRAVQLGGAELEDYIEIAAALADHFDPPRYAESLRWLDRGLAMSPVEGRLHYMKGIVLGNSGQPAAALASYRQAETIAALSMPELLDTGFYYKMAAAADRSGEQEAAAGWFEKAVALVPSESPELATGPLNDHGYMLLMNGGDVDAAGALIRRAVALDPDNPVYLDSLGWYYFKKALFRKALVELRRAKQLMGDDVDPDVQAHLDAVREALGKE